MHALRRVTSLRGIEALKLLTAIVLLVSLMIVIHDYHPKLRVDDFTVWLFLGVAIVIGGLIFFRTRDSQQRLSNTLLFFTAVWAASLALILPTDTPFIVINPFLVIITATYLTRWQLMVSISSLLFGVEVSFITADTHPASRLVFITIHAISLVLVGIFAVWYKRSLIRLVESDQRKQEQSDLERERLQSLINSMTDGVVAIDTHGIVAIYNGAALDILNVNASLENKNITDYLTFYNKEGKFVPVMKKVLNDQGYMMSRDYQLEVDDNERINVFVSISPVRVGFGKSGGGGFIILLRDITREKSLEEERDEFISVVSHELRTPTAIAEGNISNSLFLAKQAKIDSKVTDSLEEAHEKVIFLAEMVNDLATLSRAEQNKLQVEPEDIDVHELVKSLQRDYRTDAQQKGIEFTTHVDKNVKKLFSSRLYVREVLENFITNAIKYTEKGKVQLSVKQAKGRIEFAVMDTGIGISKSDQKLLFNKFFRSEDYRTRKNSGTGLGLYVTSKLARLINAEITLDSELNKGSVFRVFIPSLARKTRRAPNKTTSASQ